MYLSRGKGKGEGWQRERLCLYSDFCFISMRQAKLPQWGEGLESSYLCPPRRMISWLAASRVPTETGNVRLKLFQVEPHLDRQGSDG